MDPITLSDKLAALQSDPNVRSLLAAGSKQDAAAIHAAESIDVGTRIKTRISIISFLNAVHYATIGVCDLPPLHPMVQWVWENNMRLKKLLTVSMALEGKNRLSFGDVDMPSYEDIPDALVQLAKSLVILRKMRFTYLEKEHKVAVEYLQAGGGEDYGETYLDLYTKDRPSKQQRSE